MLPRTNYHIVQINALGQVTPTYSITEQNYFYFLGDVDDNGDLWLSDQGFHWLQFHIPTRRVTAYRTTNGIPAGAYDWAFVPGTSCLYTVTGSGGNNVMWRFDHNAKSWASVRNFGQVMDSSIMSATYAGQDSYLYCSVADGQNYRFSLSGTDKGQMSTSPFSSQFNGAHRINAYVIP